LNKTARQQKKNRRKYLEAQQAIFRQPEAMPVCQQNPDQAIFRQSEAMPVCQQSPDQAVFRQPEAMPVFQQNPDQAVFRQPEAMPVCQQNPQLIQTQSLEEATHTVTQEHITSRKKSASTNEVSHVAKKLKTVVPKAVLVNIMNINNKGMYLHTSWSRGFKKNSIISDHQFKKSAIPIFPVKTYPSTRQHLQSHTL
jgi:hypothetical protein